MTLEVAQRSITNLKQYSREWYDFLNLSAALYVLGETDLALLNARKALSLARTPHTLINLAVMLEARSRFHSAFPLAEEAYALAPDDNFAAILYSDALFRLGRTHDAWPIYARSHTNWSAVADYLPAWDGMSLLAGKRILVLPGGGYGDMFFHLRWIPYLTDLGARVTFMCPPSMHSLLGGRRGFERLVAGDTKGFTDICVADYDLHTCVLALGGYFPGVQVEKPYLACPIKQRKTGAVGLCTRAGEEKIPRRNRSLTDSQTARIRDILGDRHFDLNYDSWQLPSGSDWGDTAACVGLLDFVITVDTGVAHLSGALGIPTWLILPGNSALYYGVSGSSCPWYPSHRLFRNGGEGIDNSVSAVCEALRV